MQVSVETCALLLVLYSALSLSHRFKNSLEICHIFVFITHSHDGNRVSGSGSIPTSSLPRLGLSGVCCLPSVFHCHSGVIVTAKRHGISSTDWIGTYSHAPRTNCRESMELGILGRYVDIIIMLFIYFVLFCLLAF